MKTTITQNLLFRTLSRLQRSCWPAVFLVLFLLSASSSWGQIEQRGSTVKTSGNATSVTLTKPTGVENGDLLILNLAKNNSTIPTCTGWTILSSRIISGNVNGYILYKIANCNEAANYTITLGSSTDYAVGIMAFSGVSTLNPFDVSSTTMNLASNNATATAIGVTTVTNNSAILMLTQLDNNKGLSGWAATAPSSLTEILEQQRDGSQDLTVGAAFAVKTTAGSTGNGTCTISSAENSASILLALRPGSNLTVPTNVTATSSSSTICSGSSVNLTSSATSNSNTATTLLNENFNGSATGWTTTNTSSGGTSANAAWTLRPNGYNNGTSYGATISSNDASQFYLTDSDKQGSGGTTATTLKSPAFSTVGLSAASLTFYQYYRDWDTTDSAIVEVSTNNTSWTTLATYTATDGANDAFALKTISLNSYLGQATVYIRFKYTATYSYYWAIDNVSVTGTLTTPPAATFAWTSSPAGYTSALQNPTGVAPTATTTYTVTATNSYGCTATANVSVNVNTVTAGAIGTSQTICSGGDPAAFTSTTAGTGSGTITYRWESSVSPFSSWSTVAGQTNATYNVPSGLTTTTQYRRITISTLNGVACESAATATVQVTVQSVPNAGSIASAQTICSGGDPAAFTSATAGTGSGTITYRWESNTNPTTPR